MKYLAARQEHHFSEQRLRLSVHSYTNLSRASHESDNFTHNCSGRFGVVADAEFELPAAVGLGADAPQLEDTQLGYLAEEADRDVGLVERIVSREGGFQRVGFGQLFIRPAIEELTGR